MSRAIRPTCIPVAAFSAHEKLVGALGPYYWIYEVETNRWIPNDYGSGNPTPDGLHDAEAIERHIKGGIISFVFGPIYLPIPPLDPLYRPLDLTEIQRKTLVLVRDGANTLTAVAKAWGIVKTTARKGLGSLEAKGLLTYDRGAISLTDKGREYVQARQNMAFGAKATGGKGEANAA